MAFPLPTLAATVTPTGITAPPYADILTSLQTSIRTIFGQDVYLGNDTQDGQELAIFAQGMADANNACISVYNSFSPVTAQGAALSSLVKINGISRNIPSNSQVDLLVGGTVGTVITNGIAGDANGNAWALPASVTIPSSGQILVTATCTQLGAIAAVPGLVNVINTPTLGWSTVTNPSDASLGAAVETDSALRLRQTQSVALPASTVLVSTLAAVKAITGVTEAVIYENDTNATDANGLPPHSIALVVTGGDATAIAQAIANKKTPGAYTHGTTSVFVVDGAGVTHQIRFFIPTNVPIRMTVIIKALVGYVSSTGDAIKAALVEYVNNTLTIGQSVNIARLYLPAQLNGAVESNQYELEVLLAAAQPNAPASIDVPIPFNASATLLSADILLNVI